MSHIDEIIVAYAPHGVRDLGGFSGITAGWLCFAIVSNTASRRGTQSASDGFLRRHGGSTCGRSSSRRKSGRNRIGAGLAACRRSATRKRAWSRQCRKWLAQVIISSGISAAILSLFFAAGGKDNHRYCAPLTQVTGDSIAVRQAEIGEASESGFRVAASSKHV